MRVLIFKSYQCYESSKGSKAYRSYGVIDVELQVVMGVIDEM